MGKFRGHLPAYINWPAMVIISVAISFLTHMPELIALGHLENHSVFPDIRWVEVLNEILFSFLSILLLFLMNLTLFLSDLKIRPARLLLSFLVSWIVSTVLSNGFYLLHLKFDFPAVDATAHHYIHPLRDFIIAFAVTGSCYVFFLLSRHRQHSEQIQELELRNIRSQYEALKNQINPHMLFNSLNTLRSLIREDAPKAQEYTQELSHVLRYMLKANEAEQVTLAEELEFIEAYTFLLKMRYEENLNFIFQVDQSQLHDYLPPMVLQVLIENAVKHNEISSRKPLTVTISSGSDGQLSVHNPVQEKRTKTSGTGIGLDNLTKRYALLYDKEIAITANETDFCVTLPLISTIQPL